MKATREAPIGVRLSPETAEHLRSFAEKRGRTVHAEIVRAVEEMLEREWGVEPEIIALNVAAESLISRFKWTIGPQPEAKRDLIQLARWGFDALFDRLAGGEGTSETVLRLGRTAGLGVSFEMQRGDGTQLAEAGRALGVEQRP